MKLADNEFLGIVKSELNEFISTNGFVEVESYLYMYVIQNDVIRLKFINGGGHLEDLVTSVVFNYETKVGQALEEKDEYRLKLVLDCVDQPYSNYSCRKIESTSDLINEMSRVVKKIIEYKVIYSDNASELLYKVRERARTQLEMYRAVLDNKISKSVYDTLLMARNEYGQGYYEAAARHFSEIESTLMTDDLACYKIAKIYAKQVDPSH